MPLFEQYRVYGHREWVEDIDMLLNNQLKADIAMSKLKFPQGDHFSHYCQRGIVENSMFLPNKEGHNTWDRARTTSRTFLIKKGVTLVTER